MDPTMKTAFIMAMAMVSFSAIAQTLPVITSSPTNLTVVPGNTAIFAVTATGTTGYQWRFNGADIPGAMDATLKVLNAQSTNCGYYTVVVKNSTGWVPSQMAYLTLDYTYGGSQPTSCGTLPLSNTNNTYFDGAALVDLMGTGQLVPTNGTVQIVAGPELDQMQPTGQVVNYRKLGLYTFYNGYYNGPDQSDATAMPGQNIYYGIVVNFTNSGYPRRWPSTIMRLAAGTNGEPATSSYGLKFPGWFVSEGVEPFIEAASPTNQLRVFGETCTFSNSYWAYTDYGIPTTQWRKNGIPIPSATNNFGIAPGTPGGVGTSILTITNVQASDAGIYDLIVYGNEWIVGPKVTMSVQTMGGQGVFQQPKFTGTNFTCNLVGAAGRNYQVQSSTNLTIWNNLTTLSNINGTVAFTNPVASTGAQFYRTVLLP